MSGNLLNHFLLLLGCIYYLLISVKILKLPQGAQERFDRQTKKRKLLWLILNCILIAVLIILIIRDSTIA